MESRKPDDSLGVNRRIAHRVVSLCYGRIEVSDGVPVKSDVYRAGILKAEEPHDS